MGLLSFVCNPLGAGHMDRLLWVCMRVPEMWDPHRPQCGCDSNVYECIILSLSVLGMLLS
jgi:hypothetical protein